MHPALSQHDSTSPISSMEITPKGFCRKALLTVDWTMANSNLSVGSGTVSIVIGMVTVVEKTARFMVMFIVVCV